MHQQFSCSRTKTVLFSSWLLALTLSSVLLTGSFSTAIASHEPGEEPFPPHKSGHPPHPDPIEALKKELSPEQHQKLTSIRESTKPQFQALMKQSREKRMALKQYMMTPDASETKALGMQKELDAIHNQLGELKVRTWFQIKQNLTPEQLQKMKAQHESKKDSFRQQHPPKGHEPRTKSN
jgi:Spy/CpxP family protein refolding chaperone